MFCRSPLSALHEALRLVVHARHFVHVAFRFWQSLLYARHERLSLDHGRHLEIEDLSRQSNRRCEVMEQTSIERNLCNPLLLKLLVFAVPTPSVDPLLLFLIPLLLVSHSFLDTLRCSELLPFCRWFGLGQRLCAGQLIFRRRKLG